MLARISIFGFFLVLAGCGGGDGGSDITPAPGPDVTLGVARAFSNLTFALPVGMLQAPADTNRWFVIEQNGTVRTFANDADATAATVFIDIGARVTSPADGGGGETGLLGMAFHPDFPADPRVYFSYTATAGGLVSRISEFRTSDGGATLDSSSETILLTVEQPESNHNGGHLVFGPDGFLYIGLGDGGGGGDAHGSIGNGQSLQTLLGKILRIDVDDTSLGFNYAIPTDNPFEGNAFCGNGGSGSQSCPEIYAYGFRNPWRFSFDRSNGGLWVGDVGQSSWEEVDKVTSGGNYGWRCQEGAHAFNASCGPAQNLLAPVAEYGRAAGFSITGGFVYRGAAVAGLAGRYVFGDFGGRIWHIAGDTAPTLEVTAADGVDTGLQITSFAQDSNGELYVVHYGGTLHRLQAE